MGTGMFSGDMRELIAEVMRHLQRCILRSHELTTRFLGLTD